MTYQVDLGTHTVGVTDSIKSARVLAETTAMVFRGSFVQIKDAETGDGIDGYEFPEVEEAK